MPPTTPENERLDPKIEKSLKSKQLERTKQTVKANQPTNKLTFGSQAIRASRSTKEASQLG